MQLSLITLAVLASGPSVDHLLADLPGITSPPTAAVITEANGARVLSRTVTSSRPPAELKDHFARLFTRAGLFLAPEQEQWKMELGVQVSGLDTENLLSYTVMLQPSGKKGTTVVVAVVDLGARKASTAPKDLFAPLYPGAGPVTAVNLEAVKTLSYAVPATPAEIKKFYRETLGAAGYREDEPLIFTKGSAQLSLTVAPGISERYVMLQLETVAAKPR